MKFSATKRNTLLRTLWAANSLDIILDFTLTYVSVGFNYLGPYFLKRIIDLLGSLDRTQISAAYIYAFLAFLSTLCKAEADLQHLWFGRRVTTRVRSELMVAIYDKALKRKDFSGIVDKEKAKKKDAKAGGFLFALCNVGMGSFLTGRYMMCRYERPQSRRP